MNNCYSIDTGCVFGGAMTAFVEDLKTREVRFEAVKARREHFPRGAPQEP